MSDCILIKDFDASYISVISDRGTATHISEFFTYDVPNARFHPAYKIKKWDGNLRFFDVNRKLLPRGLKYDLIEFLKEEDYEFQDEVQILGHSISEQEILNAIADIPLRNSKGDIITPNQHQLDAVVWGFRNGRGTVILPTSSGKSLIIYLLTRLLDQPTMIIVPSTGLVEQMYSDFSDYSSADPDWIVEDKVNKLMGGSERLTKHKIVIATWQTLLSMKKSGKYDEYFHKFGTVMFDEVQTAKANEVNSVIMKFTNSFVRLGFTGTLPDSELDVCTIKGTFGEVKQFITTSELQKMGIVSDLEVQMLFLDYPMELKELVCSKNITYQNEIDFITTSSKRTKFLCRLIDRLEDNTLVLFSLTQHLEDFRIELERITGGSKQIFVVNGSVSASNREKIRKETEKNSNVIILATYGVFSAGVSINRLHNLIFASPRKSKVNILQSLGRLLRLHDSKDCAIIYDIVDDFSYRTKKDKLMKNYLLEHGLERSKYYIKEKFRFKIKEKYLLILDEVGAKRLSSEAR